MGILAGFDNLTGWALLQKNGPAIEKAYASDSSSASDIAYFESVAPSLNTPAKLLANYRALTFVATAYGLGSEVDQTAILQKLMTQNPNATNSLASQLSDNNYRTFANAMSTWSPPPFSTASGIAAAVAGYQQSSFQTSIGTDSVPLQEASYFTTSAKGVTSLYALMSDPALLDVVTTALGIPAAFGNLDMTQFATTAGVAAFVNKYLVMDQLNQVTSGASADPIASLFSGSSSTADDGSTPGITLTASVVNFLA
jgi:hypothetical protein